MYSNPHRVDFSHIRKQFLEPESSFYGVVGVHCGQQFILVNILRRWIFSSPKTNRIQGAALLIMAVGHGGFSGYDLCAQYTASVPVGRMGVQPCVPDAKVHDLAVKMTALSDFP